MTITDPTWHRAGTTRDIRSNEPKQFRIGDLVLAIFKINDTFYAIDDICTHQFAFLSDGFQDGEHIECPLHQSRFHIPTGKCIGPPAERDVRVFPVRIDGEDVFVDVSSESVPGDAPQD